MASKNKNAISRHRNIAIRNFLKLSYEVISKSTGLPKKDVIRYFNKDDAETYITMTIDNLMLSLEDEFKKIKKAYHLFEEENLSEYFLITLNRPHFFLEKGYPKSYSFRAESAEVEGYYRIFLTGGHNEGMSVVLSLDEIQKFAKIKKKSK